MLKKLEASKILPLTLIQLKSHLRIEHPDEDDYLNFLIEGATETVQNYIGRSLLHQVWQRTFSYEQKTPGRLRRLPILPILIPLSFPPLITIKTVKGTNSNRKSREVSNYTLSYRGDSPFLEVKEPFTRIDVTYEAGYGERPDIIPADIRQAILQLASLCYQKRCAVPIGEEPIVASLLQPYRILRQV